MARLTIRDFSQRDEFDNVNDALQTLSLAGAVAQPFINAKRDRAVREAQIAEANLGKQVDTGKSTALKGIPDYFPNQVTSQDLGNQVNIQQSQQTLKNIPMKGALDQAETSSKLKNISFDETLRPTVEAQKTLKAQGEAATELIYPESIQTPGQAYDLLRLKVAPEGAPELESQWAALPDPDKIAMGQAVLKQDLKSRGLFKDRAEAEAFYGKGAPLQIDQAGYFKSTLPIGYNMGSMGNSGYQFIPDGKGGVKPVPQLKYQHISVNGRVLLVDPTAPDGQQIVGDLGPSAQSFSQTSQAQSAAAKEGIVGATDLSREEALDSIAKAKTPAGLSPEQEKYAKPIIQNFNRDPRVKAYRTSIIPIESAIQNFAKSFDAKTGVIQKDALISAARAFRGAVPTNQEIDMLMKTSGIFQRVANLPDQILEGKSLTPEQVSDYVSALQQLKEEYGQSYNQTAEEYRQQAQPYLGERTEVVFPKVKGAEEEIPTATPEEARALPPGTKFKSTDGRILVRQ